MLSAAMAAITRLDIRTLPCIFWSERRDLNSGPQSPSVGGAHQVCIVAQAISSPCAGDFGIFFGTRQPVPWPQRNRGESLCGRIRTQKPKRKLPTLWVAAKWTFGIAETYDDCQIDKDEQYPKEKLAKP